MSLGEVGNTARGFEKLDFKDAYKVPCTLQASSIIFDDSLGKPGTSAVWLGCEDANPRVLSTSGWVPYPVPEEVLFSARAHLNREQVQSLIHHLQSWLDTGSFKI